MKMSRFRQGLVGLLALGAVASLGAGSFATFNATVGTAGNSFEMGTLTASLTPGNNLISACTSYGGSSGVNSNTNNCAAVLTASTVKPGDAPTTATLTIANTGSIAAGTFVMYMPPTQTGGVSCLDYNVTGASASGTGSPCGNLAFSVQQNTGTQTSPVYTCLYPAPASAGACSASGTLSGFATTYNSSSNGLAPTCNAGATTGLAATGNAGSSCSFTISLGAPSGLNNTYQGRGAKFDLTWFLGQ